jgi:hypothetical protein
LRIESSGIVFKNKTSRKKKPNTFLHPFCGASCCMHMNQPVYTIEQILAQPLAKEIGQSNRK